MYMGQMANTKPKVQTRNFTMRSNDEFEAMMDDLRRNEPDLPPASDMVRRLVTRAHEKLPAAKKRR